MTNIGSLTLSNSEFNGGNKFKSRPKIQCGKCQKPWNCALREQKRDQSNPFGMNVWGMRNGHGKLPCEGDTSEF